MSQAAKMELQIYEMFNANLERLRAETGRGLTPDVTNAALEQVLLYWRKLHALAENVSETEVKLTLPHQKSPQGRRYTLEGIVDIVREDNETIMYDIKTYLDAEQLMHEIESITRQLNVYAHIWQELREQDLDKTAIIATKPPRRLRRMLDSSSVDLDDAALDAAIDAWEPVREIDVDPSTVHEVIADFGEAVDKIESSQFQPPAVQRLLEPTTPGGRTPFGTEICVNCDARFSCSSYRQFAQRTQRGSSLEHVMQQYFNQYSSSDSEQERWREVNMEVFRRGEVEVDE